MGVLERFESSLFVPLCMTSVMIASVTMEMVYIILTDPRLDSSPRVDAITAGLAKERWESISPLTAGHRPGLVLGPWRILHLACLTFIVSNVVSNLCFFIQRNPSIRGVFLTGQALGQGWG
ncbi:hypothetical protein chiPu_0026584 [Chiloscyllium punctatum]|uniref:Uncharacterized protein n=1 Tax=Chiloscyllium punctatum TaxID=137246 RepID=A0A401TJB8_CHIPU|nr:hypothetical protein [Chiloscyllium punctatum]